MSCPCSLNFIALAITILCITRSNTSPYVGYELFQGFDDTTSAPNTTTSLTKFTTQTSTILATISKIENATLKIPNSEGAITTTTGRFKLDCPEEERPSNIGAYEVPTQKDMTLLIKTILLSLFDRYHEKALFFLKDIKEASRATVSVEKKCYGVNKVVYRRCVKRVSSHCEAVTKKLVTSMENRRHDVSSLMEGTTCHLAAIKTDPLQLIKVLSVEEVSLEFALPAFLRALGACSSYCNGNNTKQNISQKPSRHMTDQDLVIRHLLTQKNYNELIKDQKYRP